MEEGIRQSPFIPDKRIVTYPTSNLTNSLTDLFTSVEDFPSELQSVVVSNKTAGAVAIRIAFYDGSTDYYLWYDKSVPANDTIILEADASPIVAFKTSGYKIKGMAGATSSLDVFVNILESEGRPIT
jgi:hypothetical protein